MHIWASEKVLFLLKYFVPLLKSDLSSTYQSMSEKGQTSILDKYCPFDDLIILGSLADRYINDKIYGTKYCYHLFVIITLKYTIEEIA